MGNNLQLRLSSKKIRIWLLAKGTMTTSLVDKRSRFLCFCITTLFSLCLSLCGVSSNLSQPLVHMACQWQPIFNVDPNPVVLSLDQSPLFVGLQLPWAFFPSHLPTLQCYLLTSLLSLWPSSFLWLFFLHVSTKVDAQHLSQLTSKRKPCLIFSFSHALSHDIAPTTCDLLANSSLGLYIGEQTTWHST